MKWRKYFLIEYTPGDKTNIIASVGDCYLSTGSYAYRPNTLGPGAASGLLAQSLSGNPGRESTGSLEHRGFATPTSPRMETRDVIAVQTPWSEGGEPEPFGS